MKGRPQRLGSGLGALLPTEPTSSVREVAVADVYPNPRQPRTHFEEFALEELAASIREHGIIQPLIVSERASGGYDLIAGERRWRAARRAGLERVPIIVRETTPQQLLELAIIENVQRADLNPIEEAQAYQSLKDEFGLSDEQIAQRVGKNNRVTVANTRRLLKLPPAAQEALLAQRITAGHGRTLLKLEDPAQQQAVLSAIVSHDLTVREAERLSDLVPRYGDVGRALAEVRPQSAPAVAARSATPRAAPPAVDTTSHDDREVARELERLLSTPVSLSRSDKALKVSITFHTDEKLQEFFDLLSRVY